MRAVFEKVFRSIYPSKDPVEIKRRYNLPDAIILNVRLEDGWFIVSSPELPGLVTQARSQEELVAMVNDAVLTYFDVPRREADVVYDRLVDNSGQLIQYQAKLQTQIA
jgi:predicted RNase H-like HicB family nuclease